MAKLYETYEAGLQLDFPDSDQLMPISHTRQAAHLNVVINGDGEFIRVELLDKPQLVIPATEKSAGRTRGIEPHGLSDKIQYLAIDYLEKGGKKDHGYKKYLEQLTFWTDHDPNIIKLNAIIKYVKSGSLIKDLNQSFIIPDEKASFLYIKHKNKISFIDMNGTMPINVDFIDPPDVFKQITQKNDYGEVERDKLSCSSNVELDDKYNIIEIDIGSLLVCWSVEIPNINPSATWLDSEIQESWIEFDSSKSTVKGLCLISGVDNKALSTNFPANIRRPGDQAKLISSNDFSGFTFKGRFTDTKKSIEKYGQQSLGIGLVETQKAHNALRWLISRQGFRNDTQAIIAWAVSGKDIPQPMEDIWDSMPDEIQETSAPLPLADGSLDHTNNLGQQFSIALGKYMACYRVKLQPTDNIVIMGLDSATPGRMAVTYYQEFFPDDYIERISKWHNEFSWFQRHKVEESVVWPDCAPSPMDISEAIYGGIIGDDIKKKLKKSAIERILPCIVEERFFPLDLVLKVVHRVNNRSAYRIKEQWLWEKHLGIACALYRGFCKRHPKQTKEYIVGLEQENNSRDYLYGRLLAIAERIEEMAMIVAKEKVRTTHASRLMQRFSDRPAATWLSIEQGINPYQQRLRNKIPPLESAYKNLLDDVCDAFSVNDFTSTNKLSGEYLLGYHCQRKWLREHKLREGKWVIKNADENDELKIEGDE